MEAFMPFIQASIITGGRCESLTDNLNMLNHYIY